jgi:hypothetical protein
VSVSKNYPVPHVKFNQSSSQKDRPPDKAKRIHFLFVFFIPVFIQLSLFIIDQRPAALLSFQVFFHGLGGGDRHTFHSQL